MNSLMILENQIKRAGDDKLHLYLPNVIVLIQNQNRDDVNLKLISLINLILKKSKIKSEMAYKTLLVVLLKLINDPEKTIRNLSEELKLGIMECFELASKSLTSDVIERVFSNKSNVTLLAQCVYICVEIINKEKYIKMRIAAVNAIMGLTQTHESMEQDDIILRNTISQTIFIMLPKLIAVLIETALEESIKGHLLVSRSVFALGRILCLILEDYEKTYLQELKNEDFLAIMKAENLDDSTFSNEVLGLNIRSKNEKTKYFETTTKSKEWLKAASSKLVKPLEKLKRIRASPHYQIRFELAVMSSLLLDKCYINIGCFSSFLIENLLILADDEEAKVSDYSKNSLRGLMKNDILFHRLKNRIFEMLNGNLNSLPRILYNGLEAEQLVALKLLNGILIFIGSIDKDLSILVENHLIIEKFIGVLLICSELEKSDNSILFEFYNSDCLEDQFYNLEKPWKRFKNLINPSLSSKLQDICKNIARSNLSYTIINNLVDNLSSLEYLVLLNEILIGCPHKKNVELVVRILEDFLNDDSYWNMSICTDSIDLHSIREQDSWFKDEGLEIRIKDMKLDESPESQSTNLKLKHIKYNILCTCLVLETIGTSSTILNKSIEKYLFKLLHRILLKAGSNNFLVKSAATYSLKMISRALDLKDVSELINRNFDFLLFNIEKMLRKADNDVTLTMMSSIFNYTDSSSSLRFERIIQTILTQIQEKKFAKNNSSYLQLFKLYLTTISKWGLTQQEVEENVATEQDYDLYEKCLEELKDCSMDFEEDEKVLPSEEDFITEQEASNEEEIEEPELPSHIALTNQILTFSNQFFAGKDLSEILLVHEIFIAGLPTLKSHEKVLLPIVHQMWYSFVKQFQNNNLIVLQRSFELLVLVADLSRDFINGKSMKDVIPAVNKFLGDQLKHQSHKDNIASRQQIKLLKIVLESYGKLLVYIEVDDKVLDDTLDILLKYDTTNMKRHLGISSVSSLNDLKIYHPALVELKTRFS